MVVSRQHLPFVPADAVGEIVGIERGHRWHGQDVAVGDVQDNDRTGLVADPARGVVMKVGVDGQLDGAAASVWFGIQLLHQPAPRRHFDALTARLPAESVLKALLEALLSDLDAGNEEQRVLTLALEFVDRGRTHITDQLPDRGASRVKAREPLRRSDTRKIGKAHSDRCILLKRHVVRDRDRLEPARQGELLADAVHFVRLEIEELGYLGDYIPALVELLRDDVDAETRPVDRNGFAVTIDDPAAPWRHGNELNAVALAQELVFLVLRDREPSQAA